MNVIHITETVYSILKETVGTLPPETGAVIGAHDNSPDHITKVWFDHNAGSANEFYTPSAKQISDTVQQWMIDHYHFAGIVHSHNTGFPSLSQTDLRSAVAIMAANGLFSLYLGLFHNGELSMFKVCLRNDRRKNCVEKVKYTIDTD